MKNESKSDQKSRHLRISTPSDWISRFAPLVCNGGTVLDLACGGGRHARVFLDHGCKALCVDKNTEAVADLADNPAAEVLTMDLESGAPIFDGDGRLAGRTFDGIVVSNYLYRPHIPALIQALAPNGVLIYETFARGNEAFNRPRNPDHLLKSGELLDAVHGKLQVIAFEHGIVNADPLPGVKQRIAAINNRATTTRDDGDPEAVSLSVE